MNQKMIEKNSQELSCACKLKFGKILGRLVKWPLGYKNTSQWTNTQIAFRRQIANTAICQTPQNEL